MKVAESNNTVLLSWLVYPAVMLLCLVLHTWLVQRGIALQAAALIPVFFGAVLVTALERILPHDLNWQGKWQDVKQDFVFMLLIQVVLPRLLGLLVVLTVVGSVSGIIPPSSLWPHHWPVPLQAMLMMLAADFMRYWLHRLAHENAFLWRFHAVHHSPKKLYWLNVGRFHPVDKALQFLLDVLPFMLLGVGESVIALYFVFYAVNGFFQHSNIQMKFGFLNYIISSAELHRWHHSRVTAESNTNYGNNLIIWDWLFGTRFLPCDRDIHDLGLKNRDYPMTFSEQMRTPMTPAITDRNVSLSSFKNSIANLLLHLIMRYIRYQYWRPLLKATHDPRKAQIKVLGEIINDNHLTRYGWNHNFNSINDYADFTRYVPVNDYESLRPYIQEQEKSGKEALINDSVIMYAMTSGTTADPKLLPVTERMLVDYRRNQAIFSYLQYVHRPAALKGRYLAIVSGAIEGHTEKGCPFGSISGVLYQKAPGIMQMKYTTPPAIFELEDYALKYYLILRLALMYRNLSYIICANPSTLLKLEALINDELQSFFDEIASGSLRDMPGMDDLPQDLGRVLNKRLRPRPERAGQLAALIEKSPKISLCDVWPELAMITTWKGGSCSIALEALKKSISSATALVDLGYLSSEFRGTYTYDYDRDAGIPALQDNFYEFVSVTEQEQETARFLTLEELEKGRDYFIYVTTRGGLYRYHMNDIVRVEGFLNRTPLLCFLQKGRGVTSITGEKLYESQVIEAVTSVLADKNIESPFYLMMAGREEAVYCLYLEACKLGSSAQDELARGIDQQLCRVNIEYGSKRDSGRLAPLELRLLQDGAGEKYRLACIGHGQKEGQFKIVALQYLDELKFDFSGCLQ